MNAELLSSKYEFDLQGSKEDGVMRDIEELEIEYPHCSDIMKLCSDFGNLLYLCQECHLSLVMTDLI
jgi:hypothetical protein